MSRIVFDQPNNVPFNFDGFDTGGPNTGPVRIEAPTLASDFQPPVDPTAAGGSGTGTISLTTAGTASTQNFDTLVNTGTSNVLPTGWYLNEPGTAAAANGSYTAGTGSSTTGRHL